MSNETEATFEAGGHTWTPKFTTPVIMRTCRALGLSIDALSEEAIGKINIADFFRVLFFSVAHEAKERGVSEDEFLEAIPPTEIMDALQVLFAAVQKSFPQIDLAAVAGGSGDDAAPLDPGA